MTKRSPTVSGAGRTNGREPGHHHDRLPGDDEEDEGADDREPARAGHDPASGSGPAAGRSRGPTSDGAVRLGGVERFRVTEVGADLARGPRHGRVVEVGDRPRPREVDRDVGDDPAGARRQDDDTVGDQDRLGDAVGDHDDRRRGPIPQAEQLEVEPLAGQCIERAERLVEEQDRGLERQRPRERDALARPAGQLGGSRAGDGRVEADERGQARETRGAPIGRPAGELERVGDVVGGRTPRQEPWLLEDEPDARVRTVDRGVVEERCTGDRSEEAGDDPQERRLAAAVRADQGDDPAARDREVDRVEDRQRRPAAGRERERQVAQPERADRASDAGFVAGSDVRGAVAFMPRSRRAVGGEAPSPGRARDTPRTAGRRRGRARGAARSAR